jgi:hypothetical protein
MESDIVISEILCFLKCKFGSIPNLTLINTIVGFYDVEVICEGKKILHDIAEKNNLDVVRLKVRQGDNKKKKECEDLLSLVELIDREKCAVPTFVAADLNKVPIVKASEADVCVLMFKLEELTGVVDQLRRQVSDISVNRNTESKCIEEILRCKNDNVNSAELKSVNKIDEKV